MSSERPSSRVFWFVLISGPVVWTVHFLVLYLLVEVACRGGILLGDVLGTEMVSVVAIAFSVIALAMVTFAGVYSVRLFHRAGGDDLLDREPLDHAPLRFIAGSALILNLVFGLLILLMGVPMFFLSPCIR